MSHSIPTQRELEAARRQRRLLIIRNWLNGIFMVLATLAIIGVLVFKAGDIKLYISYGIALFAILIKMVEAIFRMPGIFNKL